MAFAVVTGDLAFSGQPAEYAEARSFFDELAATTRIDPSLFYFVPGNHDVDRSRHELAYHGGRTQINSAQRVDYYLGDVDRLAPLIDRQAAFWSFVKDFTKGQQRIVTDDGLGYVARVNLGRPIVCLLGLNSAWLSGGDCEEGKLVIGERHIINAVDAAQKLNPHLVIALAHHPVAWLTEWDNASCTTRLLPATDFYLRGHLHTHQVSLISSPAAPCVEIAAGASHDTRFSENSFNITTVYPATGTCEIRSYRYLHSNPQFQKGELTLASVTLDGSLPGNRADLAATISGQVPDAAPFSGFMAGLLTGQSRDVPVLIDGKVSFVVPSLACDFVEEASLAALTAFLGLRNLLRLYDPADSLEMRIAENAPTINQYAATLSNIVSKDPDGSRRLCVGPLTPETAAKHSGAGSWTLNLIEDLRRSQDWADLESYSRRFTASSDCYVRRKAKAALAEALMHSDESQKREEAFSIASDLAAGENASDRDFVLAGAAAEICGDDAEATRIATCALRTGRNSPELIDYARSLSMRVGSRDLRDLLDRNMSSPTTGGEP